MPMAVQAGLWGLLGGSALVLGVLLARLLRWPPRAIAAVMALGSGVLISAVAFDLMGEAFERGGFIATAGGFLAGAVVFTVANIAVNRRGGKHRKRSGSNPAQQQQPARSGVGLAIAIGALLDGIPESIVIGTTLLEGRGVSLAMVAAVFLSNVPEGLSSAAGMRKAGHSSLYIYGVWVAIAVASGLASLLGNLAFAGAAPALVSSVTAVAAGAILAMLVDTMIPEAFEQTHDFAGLITVAGFLAAFALTKLGH